MTSNLLNPESNVTSMKCVDNGQTDSAWEQREEKEVHGVDTIVEKSGAVGSDSVESIRLRELKKQQQHSTDGSCFKCDTSFLSILKRRFYCRHCGNNFCTKCCNQKVPKSMFGATSPTAMKETVLVCNVCYDLLIKKNKDKEKKS
ncbi:protrudin-like [Ylistrum balloti]|uniref:protrudin-like n=1 Tax=Ylistrum balloti TaxID=509963 RepID=UPI0029058F46|nr:protrudin-like [Ylistrum balloti]